LFEAVTLLEIFRRGKWMRDTDFAGLRKAAIQLGKRISTLMDAIKRSS
jgi:hypothetical protein